MKTIARRQFLNFLAASPLIAAVGHSRFAHGESMLPPFLIQSPDEALDIFDLHKVAKSVLPISHYGYLATGTDGNETLSANRLAFEKVYLRAMRMVDTQHIDTQTELLGTRLKSPIVIAPVGFQLYPTSDWSVASKMLKRAERAGAEFVVLTVDLNSGSNRVLLGQYVRTDERDCSACHGAGPDDWIQSKTMYSGTGATSAKFDNSSMTWEFVDRLKATTNMKVVVKGIVTAEDAILCIRHGVDAVYVSNHGGRAEASGWGALESLPEVIKAVDGAVPVLVDSGFRRGTDIFKALALGADAVCIGRVYIWGLAAFGQAGVEKVLEMLNAELRMVMGQMGTPSLADIGPQHIGVRPGGIG